ncbi:MAG: gamma carbonic anhydrase family protein [Chloroflexota bacterium]
MPLVQSHGARPRLASDVFVAPNARVVGDVEMARRSSVWFNSTIRADGAPVRLAEGVDIQDNSLVDSEPGYPCSLAEYTSLGHNATVHGSVLEDHVLIAISATVMRGCHIGAGSIIAANATLPEGTRVPPRSLVVGAEGRILRQVTDAEYQRIVETAEHYTELAERYLAVVGPPPEAG